MLWRKKNKYYVPFQGNRNRMYEHNLLRIGSKRVEILYIIENLMVLFQTFWSELPFRVNLLFGEPPYRGLLYVCMRRPTT